MVFLLCGSLTADFYTLSLHDALPICFKGLIFLPVSLPFFFNFSMIKSHFQFLLNNNKNLTAKHITMTYKKASHPKIGTRSLVSRGTTQINVELTLTCFLNAD